MDFRGVVPSILATGTIAALLLVGARAFPQTTQIINPGQTIQAAVDSSPPGTTFLLSPGIYRHQSIVPKEGNSFVGAPGADLNGAMVLTGFKLLNKLWQVRVNLVPPSGLQNGVCLPGRHLCQYPEDVYFDGVRLNRIQSCVLVVSHEWCLDYVAEKLYLADNPTGHTVELATLPHAFSGSASSVTVRGLIIEKYGNLAQTGAVHALGPSLDPGFFWVVEGNEIRYNHGAGIKGSGGMQILSNYIHHNGQIGISATGDNLLVQSNEIAYNNTAGYAYNWEAGGAKFTRTRQLVVRNNYSHDNLGLGLHTDIDNYFALYEYNRTARNRVAGILHEISFDAVIRYNTITEDGYTPYGSGIFWGAGILNMSSPNVEVYGNVVRNCMNGIAAAQYPPRKKGGPYLVQNFYVHDNAVTQQEGIAAGIGSFDGSLPVYTLWNNRYINNTYNLPVPTSLSFAWLNLKLDQTAWSSDGQH